MKKIIIILLFAKTSIVNGQIKAVTERGDTVILNDNGNWAYKNFDSTRVNDDSLILNSKKFLKNNQATLFKKSKTINMGVYFDPTKWGFQKGGIGESSEFTFINKDKELNAMFLTETTEIELSSMPEIILINAQAAGPDIEITKKEYRIVNGLKILCLQLRGSVKGIKVKYLYYVFCNETGVVQFVAYSTPKKFEANYLILEDLLNGLSITK